MNKFSVIGASFFLAGVTSWAATAPTVWFQWSSGSGGNDHWYGVSPDRGTWADMNALTVGQSYDLVSLSSAGEEEFVSALVPGYTIAGWTQGEDLAHYAWTGLNDVDNEGTFTWTDGSLLDYTHWAGGEPNNTFDFGGFVSDEDAVVLNWFTFNAGWNDLPAGSAHPAFILPAIFESVDAPAEVPEASHAAAVGGAAILAFGLWRARRARA